MAIKTFTTGEVLTAADTNTYLANSGLVYITSGTLSGTATNFAGCFSSTYDNYRIVLDKVFFSAGSDMYFQFMTGSSPVATTEYRWAYVGYGVNATGKNSNAGAGQSAGFTGITMSVGSEILGPAILDVVGPTLSQRSFLLSNAYSYPAEFAMRFGGSHFNNNDQFTGISFTTLTAATMGGRATIYGYRKA